MQTDGINIPVTLGQNQIIGAVTDIHLIAGPSPVSGTFDAVSCDKRIPASIFRNGHNCPFSHCDLSVHKGSLCFYIRDHILFRSQIYSCFSICIRMIKMIVILAVPVFSVIQISPSPEIVDTALKPFKRIVIAVNILISEGCAVYLNPLMMNHIVFQSHQFDISADGAVTGRTARRRKQIPVYSRFTACGNVRISGFQFIHPSVCHINRAENFDSGIRLYRKMNFSVSTDRNIAFDKIPAGVQSCIKLSP